MSEALPATEHVLAVLATFGIFAVSSVVPLLNAELYLIGAAALSPRPLLVPILLAATVGQMLGKVAIYYAARGALHIRSERLQRRIAAVRERYAGRTEIGDLVLLGSAAIGLPPFYVTSIAAGLLRVPVGRFVLLGFVGRLTRFSVLIIAPQLVKAWAW